MMMIFLRLRCCAKNASSFSPVRHPLLLPLVLIVHCTNDLSIAFPSPLRPLVGSRGGGSGRSSSAATSSRGGSSQSWIAATATDFSSNSSLTKNQTTTLPPQLPQSSRHPVRGESYGANASLSHQHASIPPADQVAHSLGVRPPANASPQIWQRAYRWFAYIIPILHVFDRITPPNSSLNLFCLYWKAISGKDRTSPVFDNGLTAAMLPLFSQWYLTFPQLFPRLHHANVELRTAYLDASVEYFVTMATADAQNQPPEQQRPPHLAASSATTLSFTTSGLSPLLPPDRRRRRRIRLVSFGSGYDVRSVKFLSSSFGGRVGHDSKTMTTRIDEAIELDLPHVVTSKMALLSSARFRRRLRAVRKLQHQRVDDNDDDINNNPARWPRLVPVDLNDIDAVRVALQDVLQQHPYNNKKNITNKDQHDDNDIIAIANDTAPVTVAADEAEPLYHTIFLFEAVMIYLDKGIPRALLRLCRTILDNDDNNNNNNESSSSSSPLSTGSLCFADRLENIPGGDELVATAELEQLGWRLVDWRPKPGLARHMGRAVPM